VEELQGGAWGVREEEGEREREEFPFASTVVLFFRMENEWVGGWMDFGERVAILAKVDWKRPRKEGGTGEGGGFLARSGFGEEWKNFKEGGRA
jgi:hypothetical protein